MSTLNQISLAFKAARRLGLSLVALNALYRLALKTGYFKRTETKQLETGQLSLRHLFAFPSREQILQTMGPDGLQTLLVEADEIVAGRVWLFGAEPVALELDFDRPLQHWADYETDHALLSAICGSSADVKFIWEPARFGWAFILGRAYHASADEKYAAAFWRHFETFRAANPPYLGPNWMSAQEVGIRLMSFVWAAQIFADAECTTRERLSLLTESIAQHALRIPATLLYARSQNNNHLLVEAAALYTASLALPEHPAAVKWSRVGQKWLGWCLTQQIDAYGEYVQHSTNYQRLMLQTALWVSSVRYQTPGDNLKPDTFHLTPLILENLALATHWLLSLLDPESGRVPNLGANDGALIFPFSTCSFSDYRPVVQSAARAFLGYTLPAGAWDEMSLWFGLSRVADQLEIPRYPGDHLVAPHSWGYLRAVKFKSRPSHADQLHFDLWWRGLNIAQDAGTYLYNAGPPWDNRLTSTLVHNTVSVDGQEQMTRAGRFLYLDWADASSKRYFETGADYFQRISARTYAYARLNVRHERMVTVYHDERWLVADELLNALIPGKEPLNHLYRLHWLLPDWEWQLENREKRIELRLRSPHGWMLLQIQPRVADVELPNGEYGISIVRAGEYIHGSGRPDPIRGWVSPTYAQKIPALSLAIEVESSENINFTSEFRFPTVDNGR